MTPSDKTLHDLPTPSESAHLYIDDHSIRARNVWALAGCALPLLLFWIGFLLCGMVTGW